jgi:group I intron endonuclease
MYKLENYSKLPSIQGIYFITNIVNQKYYLGRAVNIKGRYTWGNLEYSHHNYILRNSIKKYGRENFIIKVKEYPNITIEELINIEQGLLDKHYGNGLCINLSPSATNYSALGENHPCYGKNIYNNGIENKYFSPEEEIPGGYIPGVKEETREKNSGENNPNYGKKWYNDGIEERFISPEEEIPEGYIIGRKPISEENVEKILEAQKSINSKKKIRVITPLCCYFSVKDALKELKISKRKFYKLFEKDSITGFYVEKKSRSLIN